MRPRIFFSAIFAFSLLHWGGPASAVAADEPPKPIELTISGQAIEAPVLKYRLLPTEPELHAGNAAPILLRLPWNEAKYFAEVVPTFDKWATKPLDDPEWKESKGVLDPRMYDEMKRAAFRRDASWEYPIGEGQYSDIFLPDVQGLNLLIRDGLVARTRFHLTRHDLAQSRETILVGLADLRHVARTPFLVVQLIASSGTLALLGCVDEMVGLPDSPNLYWALTTLPRPMFGLRPSAELGQVAELDVPGLADLDRSRTAAEWHALCAELLKTLEQGISYDQKAALDAELFLKYANSTRKQWSDQATDDPAKMSNDEAIVRSFVWLHTRQAEKGAALLCLPSQRAIPALREFAQELKDDYAKFGISARAVPYLIMSNLDEALNVWSVDRRLDALCVVEAIRDFVATHDGKLPEKLSDITTVSVPVDPLTNQPFEWTVSDNVGRLSAAAIPRVRYAPATFEYVLRVR